jgi:hypothetical protein
MALVRADASWRMLSHDVPPWRAVYQQTSRWLASGDFAAMVHGLRVLWAYPELADRFRLRYRNLLHCSLLILSRAQLA